MDFNFSAAPTGSEPCIVSLHLDNNGPVPTEWYVPSVRPYVPPVRPSVCLSVHLSVCLSVHLSVCLSVSLSVCPSICLSVCLLLFVVVAELAIITDLERMLELFGFQAASKNVQ